MLPQNAFRGEPDLHTAAHEAAHVVQQRAGVQLKGGLGPESGEYERHADAVADRVVSGPSVEAMQHPMTKDNYFEKSGGQDAIARLTGEQDPITLILELFLWDKHEVQVRQGDNAVSNVGHDIVEQGGIPAYPMKKPQDPQDLGLESNQFMTALTKLPQV